MGGSWRRFCERRLIETETVNHYFQVAKIFAYLWLGASRFTFAVPAHAQSAQLPEKVPRNVEKIIIDTDIGDDVDDAFAIALALRSPELEILGITTTFGDTETRAKLVDRMLGEVNRLDIPVAVGSPTPTPANDRFTQRRYAEGAHFARASHPKAVDFILEQIRRYPGQITLVAIGPLMNVGAVIEKDPETFRKLRQVVLMGGSIYRGYGDVGYFPPHGPQAEWNIVNDIPSAQKLFASGVPLYVMPLDSTQLKLDEVRRAILFQSGTPLTDALTLLYHEWGQETPTLFDVMTVAYILDPKLCPVQAMRIRVDDKGFTRPEKRQLRTRRFASIRMRRVSFRLYISRVGAP
jgi:purine nucleosidase